MRLALVAIATLCAMPAFAEAVTYRGTLGGREIVLELTEPADGAVAGRFAFLDMGESVPLRPESHENGAWMLTQEGRCTADICSFDADGNATSYPAAAVWELHPDGKRLTGSRKGTGKTKEQAVAVEEIGRRPLEGEPTPSVLRDNYFAETYIGDGLLDPAVAVYETALLDGPLAEVSRAGMAGADIAYVVDPRTKFAFPRVRAFAGGADVAAANSVLSRRHATLGSYALDCLVSGYVGFGANQYTYDQPPSLGDFDQEQVTLTFASPRLLSWVEAGSTWCGGAHPYNHSDSFTFDLATGRPLDMAKLVAAWVPRAWGAAPDEIADAAAVAADPDSYYWGPSADLIAFVHNRLPEDVLTGDAELDEDCFGATALADHLGIRFAEGPSVVFTASGFPHVISVCNGDILTLPLAEVKQFLTPGAGAYFPELAE